jgi:periplasmic protein TonB
LLSTAHPTSIGVSATGIVELTASERLAAPEPPRRWRPWAWAAAVLLHVAVIAFLLLYRHKGMPQEEQSPPGVSVVFENGGQTQTQAPPAPRQGPSSIAQTPPPAAPPPPPQTAQNQPEVNLNMPQAPLAMLPSAPQAQPVPPQPKPQPQPRRPQRYIVMNNMSYGNPAPPTPQMPHAHQAMNMSLPESDAQAVNAPELTIKGDVGADWNAELTQWVNDHKYYPQAAVEQGQQGNVEIEFTVDRAGNVTGLHLLGSSGSPFLDQAWLGLFEENKLPPFPPGTKSDHVTIDATMHFELVQ